MRNRWKVGQAFKHESKPRVRKAGYYFTKEFLWNRLQDVEAQLAEKLQREQEVRDRVQQLGGPDFGKEDEE